MDDSLPALLLLKLLNDLNNKVLYLLLLNVIEVTNKEK